MPFHILVLAGGSGTRLWPLSRLSLPKHLLPIGPDGTTLLRATVERVLGLADSVHVVTTADQVPACSAALESVEGVAIIAEPIARGTGPALGLATTWIARTDPEAVICSVHADHHVGDDDAYRAAVVAAAGWALATNGLATVGIRPTHAATGFGYIELGPEVEETRWAAPPGSERWPEDLHKQAAELTANEVLGFVEKPAREVAQRYVGDNRHLWNLGLFAWPAARFHRELSRADPQLAAAVEGVVSARAGGDEDGARVRYSSLTPIAVEPLVMERTDRLTVVQAAFPWSDLGSWPDIHEARLGSGEGDAMGNVVEGDAVTLQSRNCLVAGNGGRLIAVVGGEGLIVVDTGDAVLVVPAGQAQSVRDLACHLGDLGRPDLQ
ncbi:MAG: mannose-1-phosphate guanylyltransferase [Candidatus Dormibacteria bacterium]